MAKLLLIVVGIFAAWWLLRIYRRALTRRDSPPAAAPETMVRCAHCGVHLPRSESHAANGAFFCSEEHSRLHRSA